MKTKRRAFIVLLMCAALLFALGGFAYARAESGTPLDGRETELLDSVVMVVFNFEGGDTQVTLGLVVGEAGEPSAYVLLDDYYSTDDTGTLDASSVEVVLLGGTGVFYEVKDIKSFADSRIIVLCADELIKGSRALPMANDGYAVGDAVYPCLLDGNDLTLSVAEGKVARFDTLGAYYDEEPLLHIDVSARKDGTLYNLVFNARGELAGFAYDYDATLSQIRAFDAATIIDTLETCDVPYTLGAQSENPAPEGTDAEISMLAEWKDARFGALAAEALGYDDPALVPAKDCAAVTTLVLRGDTLTVGEDTPASLEEADMGGVASLEDLAYFPNLTELWVVSNPVSDLAPVANCPRLVTLVCAYADVADLSPLSSLTELRDLYLYSNKIEDITPLASLTRLDSLGIGYNKIADLAPLSSLTALTFLRAHENRISDLTPLANLTNLEDLVLSGNLVSDLTPISALARLSTLRLDNNLISDLMPIAGILKLKELCLDGNLISDITPLGGMVKLETLSLSDNLVADLSPLAGLVSLSALDISGNPVTDYSPVSFVEDVVK